MYCLVNSIFLESSSVYIETGSQLSLNVFLNETGSELPLNRQIKFTQSIVSFPS